MRRRHRRGCHQPGSRHKPIRIGGVIYEKSQTADRLTGRCGKTTAERGGR